MSYFSNICLLKAPQALEPGHPQFISDLTEICYLAAVVEKDVESVSMPVNFYHKNAFNDFHKYLKNNPVDLVGISSMTGAFNNALKLASIAKSFDKYVVMGGYHPSALPEDVLKSPYVDAVLIGEGEESFKDFVINGPSKKVRGSAFKENGNIVRTEPRPLIKDMDSLPHPLRRIRPERFGEPGDDYSIDTIYTSRGCPWKCTFCANNIINKTWRARSPENVLEEIAMLHNPKRKKLLKFWDANFLTNVKRIEKICDLMLENKLTNFKIWTETRVDDIIRAEKIMDKLYRVGLRHVSLGIESPNANTLKLMKKNNKGNSCAEAVKILNKYNIKSMGYFIIGHYAETVEDTKRYPEFAKAINIPKSIFMIMTPYPGTVIFDEYKKNNKIISFDWDSYNNFGTVVETKDMDVKTLKKMYAYCIGKTYGRLSFFKRKSFFELVVLPVVRPVFLYFLFKQNKHNSRDEIKDQIFYTTEVASLNFSKQYNVKAPLILRYFREITLRIKHSPGTNIDFFITQDKDTRHISARKTDDTGRVNGFTIDLNKIITLGEKIDLNRFVFILCKFEIFRNLKDNTAERLKYLLYIFFNKDFISIFFRGISFITPVVGKGLVSLALNALFSPVHKKQKKYSEHGAAP